MYGVPALFPKDKVIREYLKKENWNAKEGTNKGSA